MAGCAGGGVQREAPVLPEEPLSYPKLFGFLREMDAETFGGALDLFGSLAVGLDLRFVCDGGEGGGEEALEFGGLFLEGVMHPFALAAGFDEAGAAEVGEVAGNFGLVGLQGALEEADADFAVAHEVEEAQSVFVGEGGEELGVGFHAVRIRLDIYDGKSHVDSLKRI